MKADSYAYRDRRNKKRDFRRLWITRINAAARQNGMSYSSSCTASSWPASSSTARCSRTSPSATPTPSADLPRPPARRWLRPRGRHHHQPPGRPSEAPFFFHAHHQPQQRTAQGGPQARRPQVARQAARVRRGGRGPGRRRRGRGLAPGRALVAAGSGLEGEEVAPHLLAELSQLGSGTRVIGIFDQRWAPAPATAASRCGASGTRATSGPCCARRTPSAPSRRARARQRGPVRPKAVRASMGAIFAVGVGARASGRRAARAAGGAGRARRARS